MLTEAKSRCGLASSPCLNTTTMCGERKVSSGPTHTDLVRLGVVSLKRLCGVAPLGAPPLHEQALGY
jgi:hypothetical protein